jgi:purine-binding chemotaxis protein CheW
MHAELHLVTLGLDAEIFAVPVASVIEIIAMRPLFRVPDAPSYLAGLTDVRDQAVPVIDLRRKLGLPEAATTHQTRIIVLEVEVAGNRLVVGLIADRVIEVITLQAAELAPPPQFGGQWRSDYIAGVGRHQGGFVIVFAMSRLFSTDEVRHLAGGVQTAAAEMQAA